MDDIDLGVSRVAQVCAILQELEGATGYGFANEGRVDPQVFDMFGIWTCAACKSPWKDYQALKFQQLCDSGER